MSERERSSFWTMPELLAEAGFERMEVLPNEAFCGRCGLIKIELPMAYIAAVERAGSGEIPQCRCEES